MRFRKYHAPVRPMSCRRRQQTPSPGRNTPMFQSVRNSEARLLSKLRAIAVSTALTAQLSSAKYQYSLRRARPEKQMYFWNTDWIAS